MGSANSQPQTPQSPLIDCMDEAAQPGPSRAVAAEGSAIKPLSCSPFDQLKGRRIVLASASPRRREILQSVGVQVDVVASKFDESLPKSSFLGERAFEYPVETGRGKALEVYHRLLKEEESAQGRDDRFRAADLVIAADTVVVSSEGDILEKPLDNLDHQCMLGELNDSECQVITGVTIVHPVLTAPGYKIHSLSEITKVSFADSSDELLKAYVDDGEGSDRAGGFAIQGKGGLLVKGIEGDWNNVVGFPIFSFYTFLQDLFESGELSFE